MDWPRPQGAWLSSSFLCGLRWHVARQRLSQVAEQLLSTRWAQRARAQQWRSRAQQMGAAANRLIHINWNSSGCHFRRTISTIITGQVAYTQTGLECSTRVVYWLHRPANGVLEKRATRARGGWMLHPEVEVPGCALPSAIGKSRHIATRPMLRAADSNDEKFASITLAPALLSGPAPSPARGRVTHQEECPDLLRRGCIPPLRPELTSLGRC